MKNKFKSIFLLALSVGVLATSCSEDDHTGASLINYTSPNVSLTASENNVVIPESTIDPDDGYVITVTASIAEPVFTDIHIPLVQTGGNAGSGDFTSGTIIILSGLTSASTDVTFWLNCENGDDGDKTLELGAADNISNVNMDDFTLNVNIMNDWINDVLALTFAWDGELTYDGTIGEVTISFCDVDLDFPLTDDMGNVLGYIAGSGDCPEEGELSGLADGTYYIIAEVYDNPFEAEGLTDVIPVTTSYSQCGFDTEGSFENSTFNAGTPSNDAFPIAIVEVSGGYNYTITPWQ